MTSIKAFNQTMDYLETVLDDEIDQLTMEKLSGYSFSLFSRIFSVLTDTTLQEYLRQRRLTRAAQDLRDSEERVIDLAMKYGYQSPDAFTQAFRRFHGVTPSDVRAGKSFRIYPKLQLSLKIQGGRMMDITIEQKPGFRIAGIKRDQVDPSQCPIVWEDLMNQFDFGDLIRLGNGQSFGMCYSYGDSSTFDYMAGFDVRDEEAAKAMGLHIFEIEPAEYAIVPVKGAIPKSIHDSWKYVIEVFFPEQGYRHAGTPDFEVYSEGDMTKDDYEMELWVPIKKVN